MGQVMLQIGDRAHQIACADGDEPRLLRLGAMLDERWPSARRAAGAGAGERAMLLIALMLADSLEEAQSAPPPPTDGEAALLGVAERLEALAEALERDATI
jgi:cell division protein ZapA